MTLLAAIVAVGAYLGKKDYSMITELLFCKEKKIHFMIFSSLKRMQASSKFVKCYCRILMTYLTESKSLSSLSNKNVT